MSDENKVAPAPSTSAVDVQTVADERPDKRTSGVSRGRRVTGGIVLVLLVAVLGWRGYVSRDYWQTAWAQATLFPQESTRSGGTFSRSQRVSPFDLSRATIPREEIRSGGPRKDGIPALSKPALIDAANAKYLQAGDRVVGVVIGDEARAYPLKILNYHEIVNDRIGTTPLAVTYCPLCDSAAAFDRRTPLGEREFGVSGLLYNSNVLMYDRTQETESLWSQLKRAGISGPAAEKTLKALPLELTTWKDWLSRHPKTEVLSNNTGHQRDYSRSPYQGYFENAQLMFPVNRTSKRLPTKARVLGVWTDKVSRAYPESAFSSDHTRVKDRIDGKIIVIEFNPEARSLRVVEAEEGVQWMYSLWFAWYAFHPETEVYKPQ